MSCVLILVAIGAIFLWFAFNRPTPPKLFGVYAQPGPFQFFKEIIFAGLMKYRMKQSGKSSSAAGYGTTQLSEVEKERIQALSGHPKGIDAVYFNGANKEGAYIVTALARRPRGVFNAMLYLRLPDFGLLQLPRKPDTLLFGDENLWKAEGLSIAPKEPMKTWQISYSGKLRKWKKNDAETKSSGELHDVKFEFEWTATFPHFDFDGDVSVGAFSRSMAKESWSKKYFEDLKAAHQTHYEQMGKLKGYAIVDEKKFELELYSMRDHSYGVRREWRLLHRYALHMVHTNSGTQLNVGIVSQPITCSHIELGYIGYKGEHWKAISRVNLDLWRYGENGTPPTDYAFSFEEGGKTHYLEIEVLDAPVFFMGWEWEARICELFVKIKLDGEPGFGVVEYQYNNGPGDHRPEMYRQTDPEWAHTLNKG